MEINVESSILFFTKTFGQGKNYKALMNAYSGMPKIVEMIVYMKCFCRNSIHIIAQMNNMSSIK